MYKYTSVNNILSPNQSGFRSGDSCVNQLLSIIHDIYYSFDEGFKTRAIFLHIYRLLIKLNTKDVFVDYVNMVFPATYCLFRSMF